MDLLLRFQEDRAVNSGLSSFFENKDIQINNRILIKTIIILTNFLDGI